MKTKKEYSIRVLLFSTNLVTLIMTTVAICMAWSYHSSNTRANYDMTSELHVDRHLEENCCGCSIVPTEYKNYVVSNVNTTVVDFFNISSVTLLPLVDVEMEFIMCIDSFEEQTVAVDLMLGEGSYFPSFDMSDLPGSFKVVSAADPILSEPELVWLRDVVSTFATIGSCVTKVEWQTSALNTSTFTTFALMDSNGAISFEGMMSLVSIMSEEDGEVQSVRNLQANCPRYNAMGSDPVPPLVLRNGFGSKCESFQCHATARCKGAELLEDGCDGTFDAFGFCVGGQAEGVDKEKVVGNCCVNECKFAYATGFKSIKVSAKDFSLEIVGILGTSGQFEKTAEACCDRTCEPTMAPTVDPTSIPTSTPTLSPTNSPTVSPTAAPTGGTPSPSGGVRFLSEMSEITDAIEILNEATMSSDLTYSCNCVDCDEDPKCGGLWRGDTIGGDVDEFDSVYIVLSHCLHSVDWLESFIEDVPVTGMVIVSKCGKSVEGSPTSIPTSIVLDHNVGRNDHTYAAWMASSVANDSLVNRYLTDKSAVVFLKDDISKVHQIGGRRSLKDLLRITSKNDFACGVKPGFSKTQDGTSISISTYHVGETLENFQMNEYKNDQIIYSGMEHANVAFASPLYKNLGEWSAAIGAPPISHIAPVCYGGIFAVRGSRIVNVGSTGVWAAMALSLSRGNSIEEGHFAERTWARILSKPLSIHELMAIEMHSDGVAEESDSYMGALAHNLH